MMRITTALAALLAGIVLASCGDDGEPIPSGRAERLEALLQDVQRQTESNACNQLTDTTLPRLVRESRRLPDSVSSDTRETIEDGVNHLRSLATDECSRNDQDQPDTTTEETTAPTTTVPPTTTETTPPETTTTEEPPTTETTPPETTPPPDTAPPPDEPGNGGTPPDPGNGNGNGGTPPGQEKKAGGGKKGGGEK